MTANEAHGSIVPAGVLCSNGRLVVRGVQLLFVIIAVIHLNAPFLSAHNERQNQTYDVARHIFSDGWTAVLSPKVSFSLPGFEAQPYTVVRYEFPFPGLISWPFVELFGHERAVMRLVSVAFAVASIELIFLILRQWLSAGTAAAGAALWGLSPLVLHFGQVPMPDIFCTTGMLAAFWFALRNNLPASSGAFLFAILGKISVIVFGLPILTALLVARRINSFREFFRISLLWGIVPLIGIAGWNSLQLFHNDTPWTIAEISGRGIHLFAFVTCLSFFACLLPFGLGLVGAAGCVLAITQRRLSPVDPFVLMSLAVAVLIYLIFIFAKIPEPQYALPLLAWAVIFAAFGLGRLADGARRKNRWRWALAAMVGLQLLTVAVFTADLKSNHVADFESVQKAAGLMPPKSRVLVVYPFYGASPAVWLNQNDYAINHISDLETQVATLEKDGFDYLLIMDLKSWLFVKNGGVAAILARLPHPASLISAKTTGFADPASPFRHFCDSRFTSVYSSPYVVLYRLPAPGNQAN
jgi:hypothetical protein